MRPAQKSNRSRGRGNRKNNSGGGGGGGNSLNRVYDSAGPEGKVRGTPAQIIEKYLTLARDAQTSGDRVTSENFLQHAEHYQRIVIQATTAQEQARKDAEAAQPKPEPEAQAQGDAGSPAAQPQPQQPQQNRRAPRSAPAQEPQPAPTPEIGGMAMIDAEPAESSLVVEASDTEQPPAKPNGRGRRKKPVVAEDAPAVVAAEPVEPQAET